MSNMLLFGATVLLIMHLAGSVLDANDPGDFSVLVVVPGENLIPTFCVGLPSELGSDCIAVANKDFFAPTTIHVVSPAQIVTDSTEYEQLAISNRVDYELGVTPGYYLTRIDPPLRAEIEEGSYLMTQEVVDVRQIPVQVAAGQSNQGAFSWILNGAEAVPEALKRVLAYLTFDYPMLEGGGMILGLIRVILTFMQNAFILIALIYGVRLIRGAG